MLFAVSEHDYQKADSLERLTPEPDTIVWRMLQAYHTRDYATGDALLARYFDAPTVPVWVPFYTMTAGETTAGERLRGALLRQSPASGRTQQTRLFYTASLSAWRGRYRSALADLSRLPPGEDMGLELGIASQPFVRLSRIELLALRERLLRMDVSTLDSTLPAPLLAVLREYALGVLGCQLGNHEAALEQAAILEKQLPGTPLTETVQALAAVLRAFEEMNTGQSEQALHRLERIELDTPIDLIYTAASRDMAAVWQAELLYRLGRTDEALQWFEHLPESLATAPSLPFATLRRAQIHEARGEAREANRLYGQYVEHMAVADAEVQPLVRHARARLAAIRRRTD